MVEVQIFGEGDDVVVLHGVPAPPESVDAIREGLQESYRVLVPDLHGVGVDPETAIAMLEEALEAHDVEEAAIIGHSFGSYRAFQLARSGRLDVTHIAALSPLVYYPDEVRASYDQLAEALGAGALDVATLAGTLAQQWFADDFLEEHADAAQWLQRWFDAVGREGLLDVVRIETKIDDLRPVLPDISVPVYIRVGQRDEATPVEWAREIAELLPEAQIDVAARVGHFPQYEDREATLAAIKAFLSSR